MSAHAKRRRTDIKICIGKKQTYWVPKKKALGIAQILEDYKESSDLITADEVFHDLDQKYSKKANTLCGLRLKKNWTQTQLAKKLGTSQANVSAMETGRRNIGKNLSIKLAKIFSVSEKIFLET